MKKPRKKCEKDGRRSSTKIRATQVALVAMVAVATTMLTIWNVGELDFA